MSRNIILISILLSFCTQLNCIVAQSKDTSIKKIRSIPGFKHASIGISVKDMSGKTITSYNEHLSLTPASVLKIVTTATALEMLGADYKYKTTLAKDKNNSNRLLIHGYGDPTLGSAFIDKGERSFVSKWIEEITKNFDQQESMSITVIDNYFGYEGVSQKWLREDMGNYYASGTYGISLFDNTYQLQLNTMRGDTLPIIVETTPDMANNLWFCNTLLLNHGGDSALIMGDPLSDMRMLTGSVPARRSAFMLKGSIPNPGLYLAEMLADTLWLNNKMIASVSNTKESFYRQMHMKQKTDIEEEVFYIHQSPPMKDIIREVNVNSNNHYAEHIIRTIGRLGDSDIYNSALNSGIKQVAEYWGSKYLNTDALFMYDACGLAPSNAVSADFVTNILVYMQSQSKHSSTFLHSLPKAGSEGTVRNFLRGTRLAGKVFVKSGSIANVRCYAGYYIDGEKKYAFTIMLNNFNSPRSETVKAIEKILLDVLI